MNVAGPSGGVATKAESTYEQRLLALWDQLGHDESNKVNGSSTRETDVGEPSLYQDVAANEVSQRLRALIPFDQDWILAERLAADEDEYGRWFSGSRSRSSLPDHTDTAALRTNDRPADHDCVICQEPIYSTEIRAPCGHYYDISCITDLFQSAIRDETLYPPRCCRQKIPFSKVWVHLPQAIITALQEKDAEVSTLNRVYCSSPTCNRFLGSLSKRVFIRKVYTCPAPNCGRRTCGKCRGQYIGVGKHVCLPDEATAQVLELGRAYGWSRCPGCLQMIELSTGCYHITCRCRTEFCYLCRARWKSCQCPRQDERRLLALAEERVDAQLATG